MQTIFDAFDLSGPSSDAYTAMAGCLGIILIVVIVGLIGSVLFGVSDGGHDDD